MSHSDVVLLIGPLPPLLPRALRVRLKVAAVVGAAAVFTVVLLATIVLAIRSGAVRGSGLAALDAVLPKLNLGRGPDGQGETVAVVVNSRPVGATILLDNHQLGNTPANVNVSRDGLLTLRRAGFLDAFVRANATNVEVPLWQAQPDVRVVRPPVLAPRSARRCSCPTVAFRSLLRFRRPASGRRGHTTQLPPV